MLNNWLPTALFGIEIARTQLQICVACSHTCAHAILVEQLRHRNSKDRQVIPHVVVDDNDLKAVGNYLHVVVA